MKTILPYISSPRCKSCGKIVEQDLTKNPRFVCMVCGTETRFEVFGSNLVGKSRKEKQ